MKEVKMKLIKHRSRKSDRKAVAFFVGAIVMIGAPGWALAEDGAVQPPTISVNTPIPDRKPVLPTAKKQKRAMPAKAKLKPVVARTPTAPVVKTAVKLPKKSVPVAKATKRKKVASSKPKPAYSCAGLNGDDFEPVFGQAVVFQGPDENYECALSTVDDSVVIAVSKIDSRTWYRYSNEAGDPENFAKDAVSWENEGNSYINMMLAGGRQVLVKAQSLRDARIVAGVVEDTWPKLTPDQKAEISSGTCQGVRSALDSSDVSPHAYDVMTVTEFVSSENEKFCSFVSEGGDFEMVMYGIDDDGKGWEEWTPFGSGVEAYVYGDEPNGFEKIFVQSKTFGLIQLRGWSANSKLRGISRRISYSDQEKFLRELANKLFNS
jgi:hypothetical protein